jgi:ribA/ribD-fused uncharacterized protein
MITFYGADGPYGCFSNFSYHPLYLRGKQWLTSEHFYQAMKSLDQEVQETIRRQPTPGKAARLGKKIVIRKDWDEMLTSPSFFGPEIEVFKDSIMVEAVFTKFVQNCDIAKTLVDTGDVLLVEDAPRDSYWGWGPSKVGRNKLGKILMIVRGLIRKTAFPSEQNQDDEIFSAT